MSTIFKLRVDPSKCEYKMSSMLTLELIWYDQGTNMQICKQMVLQTCMKLKCISLTLLFQTWLLFAYRTGYFTLSIEYTLYAIL